MIWHKWSCFDGNLLIRRWRRAAKQKFGSVHICKCAILAQWHSTIQQKNKKRNKNKSHSIKISHVHFLIYSNDCILYFDNNFSQFVSVSVNLINMAVIFFFVFILFHTITWCVLIVAVAAAEAWGDWVWILGYLYVRCIASNKILHLLLCKHSI